MLHWDDSFQTILMQQKRSILELFIWKIKDQKTATAVSTVFVFVDFDHWSMYAWVIMEGRYSKWWKCISKLFGIYTKCEIKNSRSTSTTRASLRQWKLFNVTNSTNVSIISVTDNVFTPFSTPWSAIERRTTAEKVPMFGVILVRIHSKCGKIRTRITPNTDTFQVVTLSEKEVFFNFRLSKRRCATYYAFTICIKRFSIFASRTTLIRDSVYLQTELH